MTEDDLNMDEVCRAIKAVPTTGAPDITALIAELRFYAGTVADRPQRTPREVSLIRLLDTSADAITALSASHEALKQENEKWRGAARVLCGGCVGVPQPKGCPACRAEAAEAQVAALTAALDNLASAHDGYRQGLGPCVCGPHVEARKVLSKEKK